MKELSVIVVTHSIDVEMFRKMLTSLRNYTPEIAQLIVFDNASETNHRGLIENIFKDNGIEIDYIRNDINIGYGQACNKSLPLVNYEFMATLNDDIEFFDIWSTQMIEILKDNPKVAQVVPKYGVCNALYKDGGGHATETDIPEYAEGSCCMTRTALMKEFGFYDEIYEFAYCEDSDLSLRLRKAGYQIRNAEINWIHYGETTASKVKVDLKAYQNKNNHIFRLRWNTYLQKKIFI